MPQVTQMASVKRRAGGGAVSGHRGVLGKEMVCRAGEGFIEPSPPGKDRKSPSFALGHLPTQPEAPTDPGTGLSRWME